MEAEKLFRSLLCLYCIYPTMKFPGNRDNSPEEDKLPFLFLRSDGQNFENRKGFRTRRSQRISSTLFSCSFYRGRVRLRPCFHSPRRNHTAPTQDQRHLYRGMAREVDKTSLPLILILVSQL